MEPRVWDRIQEIYHSALPLPRTQRKDFVDRECNFDSSLMQKIYALLEADETASGFLEAPVFALALRIISQEIPAASINSKPDDNLIGTTIDSRYVVISRLAEGGMARVYKAGDLRLLQKPVVVKVLLDESLRNERIVRKFQQEKEALARVDHPGVVNILDAGELPDKKPYLVEQFIEGISLREVIASSPEGLDFDRAAKIAKGIGSALNAAHKKAVYHRDLKPENIMLQDLGPAEEWVKVLDFGIAKVKESLIGPSTSTSAGTMGTLTYMSPEQLRGNTVAAPSDVYSFAVVAYEMLTGRRPFAADTVGQLTEMQREGVRVKPSDLRPRLASDVDAIILNGLAFAPEDRALNAAEFGDRLSRALLPAERPFPALATRVEPAHAAGTLASPTKPGSSQLPRVSTSNTGIPETNSADKSKIQVKHWRIFAGALVLLALLLSAAYWFIFSQRGLFGNLTNSRPSSSAPHRTINYSLTVQKMRDGKPYKEEFESSGQEVFESGYRFRLNISSRQDGYLYMFNEGPPEQNQSSFTLIYPTPAINDGSARVEQNQDTQTNWNTFTGETGTERFWIIWSTTQLAPLEFALHDGLKNPDGAISDASVVKGLKDFLLEHSNPQPETIKDTPKQRTTLRVSGDVLVKLLELEHR